MQPILHRLLPHLTVNLRGADVGMSQDLLDDFIAQAFIQQQGGATVTAHVKGEVALQSGQESQLFQAAIYILVAEAFE